MWKNKKNFDLNYYDDDAINRSNFPLVLIKI